MKPDLWSSDGRIGDSSTNSSYGITVAWVEAGIIQGLDAIACIESEKSDITCNDKYIVSCLHFVSVAFLRRIVGVRKLAIINPKCYAET